MEEVLENEKVKKPIGKKITSIVMLCVAGILVLSLLLCYFVPKSYAPELNRPDFVKVYTSSGTYMGDYNKNSEVYNKILSLYDESYQVSIMDSLLTGNLGYKGELVSPASSISNQKTKGEIAIEFCYNEVQTIKVNGQDADVATNKYIVATVVLNNSTELAQSKIYYLYYNSSDNSSKTYSYHYFDTLAHQSALYNYIKGLYA